MKIRDQILNAIKLAIRRSSFAPILRKLLKPGPLSKAIEIGRNMVGIVLPHG